MEKDERLTRQTPSTGGEADTIRLFAVRVEFKGSAVLQDASVTASRGQVVGLMGPNGSGKSTLLRVLAGLLQPTEGSGMLLGHELGGSSRPRTGLMLERPPFVESRTGLVNLRMLARLDGTSEDELEPLLLRMGLNPSLRTPVVNYSQGMRKRLGLAQAIMGGPDILLLDEPMNGLDVRGLELLEDVVCQEAARGAVVFVSSHLLDEMARMCDVVYALVDGRCMRVKERYLTRGGLRAAYLSMTEGRTGEKTS